MRENSFTMSKKYERKRSSRKLGISERNKMRETQSSTWNMTI
jgi:hypothetical protein